MTQTEVARMDVPNPTAQPDIVVTAQDGIEEGWLVPVVNGPRIDGKPITLMTAGVAANVEYIRERVQGVSVNQALNILTISAEDTAQGGRGEGVVYEARMSGGVIWLQDSGNGLTAMFPARAMSDQADLRETFAALREQLDALDKERRVLAQLRAFPVQEALTLVNFP